MILLLICGILFLCYSLLVIYFWYGWKSVPLFTPDNNDVKTPVTISVIIPARNEAENIAALLEALQKQTYPPGLFEIIVVDDHSTDNTAVVVKNFGGVKLVSLQADDLNSYKKRAVETGVVHASGELIVCTDADCVPGPGWLRVIAWFAAEKKATFIAAPVVINCNSSVLQIFQAMDFMILQAITGAVVHNKKLSMSNGANIAYTRQAFYDVNGFSGIDSIASGDDMLLMYKIWKQYPGEVHYLKSKEAIVATRPQETWKAFFNQRIRWASKAARYEDKRFFPVLLLVYLFNLLFPVLFAAGFFCYHYWLYLAALLGGKTMVELPLFISAAAFFDKRGSAPLFFIFQPLHILYTVISGFFSQFGKYEWKGRRVR
ncbi:MAG: glycosyltransferase [Bacteroidetes bacterium]|nr:glycosyltransferase [Bacteroidota bacterium]